MFFFRKRKGEINTMKKELLIKNTMIILVISIVAKICSFLWEALLAAKLGTSYQSDALYMILGIFNIIFPILDIGIWKLFLPIYKQKMVKESVKNADEFANKFETLFLIISILLVLFIIILSKPIVYLIAPGFSAELKEITIRYLKLSAPMYLLMSSSSLVGAILQCHGKFFGSQIREVASHLSKIIFFLFCYHFLGIYSAIIAYIIGSILRLLIQLPFIDWKYKFKFDFNFKDKKIIELLRSLPSVAITAAIAQINSLIDKMIASNAVEGAISCLNYGNKLVNVFSGMITTALATAVYPNMAEYAAKKDGKKMSEELKKILIISIVVIVPITFFCFFFANEIVTIVFQRGKFNAESTFLTSNIFKYYSIGMLFSGLTTILTNVFYVYGDTKTTLKVSILNVVLNIIFNIIFYHYFGIIGLAFATSLSTIICYYIRLSLLKKYVKIDYYSINIESVKVLISSILACLISYFIFNFIKINLLLKLVFCAIIMGTCFISFGFFLKIKSIQILKNILLKKREEKNAKN